MKTGQMLGKHYECYDRRRLQYTGTPARGEGDEAIIMLYAMRCHVQKQELITCRSSLCIN